MKKRKKVPYTTKALLQKEINSECPFCSNQEVECFEVHHINKDTGNNGFKNLLLMCPTCHAKIEKRIITNEIVVQKKSELKLRSWKVEFVSIVVDNSCGWIVGRKNKYAYFSNGSKPKNPILNFIFINHLSKTIVLKTIVVKHKPLFSGLSGPPPKPEVLYPLAKYHISLNDKISTLHLENPIEVPADKAFQFQIELSNGAGQNLSYPFGGRTVYFTFQFSSVININTPAVFFNCNSEDEGLVLIMNG